MGADGIRRYAEALVQMGTGHKGLEGMVKLHRLLLDKGLEWVGSPKPKNVRYGKKNLCYMNAFNLATNRPELTYVEGYGGWHIPTFHAWCVNAEGRVIDPTWRYSKAEASQVQYLGLPLKLAWVTRMIVQHGYYGVLPQGRMLDVPEAEWLDSKAGQAIVNGRRN